MAERERFYYQFQMDHGEFAVYIPVKVSDADVKDIEDHFALMVRQARRRIVDEPISNKGS